MVWVLATSVAISQIRELSLEEVKQLTQGRRARRWQGQDLNLDLYVSRPLFFTSSRLPSSTPGSASAPRYPSCCLQLSLRFWAWSPVPDMTESREEGHGHGLSTAVPQVLPPAPCHSIPAREASLTQPHGEEVGFNAGLPDSQSRSPDHSATCALP